MMKNRRKPNSMNSLSSFSNKTETNGVNNDISINGSFDNLKSADTPVKKPSTLPLSTLPVINGSSFDAYDAESVRTATSRKYLIIFIAICTLGSLTPLMFHVAIFKSNVDEQRIIEEISLPHTGNQMLKRRARLSFADTQAQENKSLNTTSLNLNEEESKVINPLIEQRFIELAEKWKSKTPEIARALNIGFKPSENKPFIFFHQRKAGGSTFRQFLYDAANNLGARSWIPSCRFGPIPCAVFALPTHAKFAVYGGHFRYMEAHKNFVVTNFKTFLQNKRKPKHKPFTCLVTARPTLDRVVSCWNYRFIQELKLEAKEYHATSMTASQWDELLPTAFSKFNEGCNNEFIRNFGDIQDEIVINSMKPTGEEKYDLLALRELNNVFERISNCVVTTLPKCDEGLEVIGYFLPWLQRNAKYDCENKVNAVRSAIKEGGKELTSDAENAILKHNFVDELVYDFIDTLFDEQLKYARANRKSDVIQLPVKRTKAIKDKAKKNSQQDNYQTRC